MRQVSSLNHTRWECKYHIVFIPKYRRKMLFGQIRRELGEVFHRLARQKESLIEEGHVVPDHVPMMISIPPKYAVAQVVGYIKGKSAIHIARQFAGKTRNYVGQHFWARGYFASTVGRDEGVIRNYIRHQEAKDRRIDQMRLMLAPFRGSGNRRFHNYRFERPTNLKPPALPENIYYQVGLGRAFHLPAHQIL